MAASRGRPPAFALFFGRLTLAFLLAATLPANAQFGGADTPVTVTDDPANKTNAPTTAPSHNGQHAGPAQASYLTYIGAGISITGNLCISAGLNVQKFVHMKIAEAEVGAHDGVISANYAEHRIWWVGMILMAIGETGNFGAYFFAPASLVAPLGTVTVVSNAVIAPLCLHEVFRRRDGAGVFLAVAGAILIVVGAPDGDDALDTETIYRQLLRPVFLGYAITIITLAIGCYYALRKGYGEKYIWIPLFITATLGSFTILSVKSLSMLLRETFDGSNQFKAPLIYFVIVVLVGTAVTQVKFLNYAMAHFNSTEVVPTFFVMFTIAAILIGAIFFEDFEGVSEEKRGIFSGGILLCFFGVYLITSKRNDKPDGSVSYSPETPDDLQFNLKPARSDQSYLLLPDELYTRDRSDTGKSLTALNPLLGVETTPLLRSHRRLNRLRVNDSGGSDCEGSPLAQRRRVPSPMPNSFTTVPGDGSSSTAPLIVTRHESEYD